MSTRADLLRARHGADYFARIARIGGARRSARAAASLGRFDPGPPVGPHDEYCDARRRARVGVEVARAACRLD